MCVFFGLKTAFFGMAQVGALQDLGGGGGGVGKCGVCVALVRATLSSASHAESAGNCRGSLAWGT